MRRNQGDHLKWNEVKAGIIEFIISNNGPVPEPEIRDFLGEKYKIKDQGNIKKHLRDLQYHPYSCIEKIPGKKGYANRWDIKQIENLKNIRLHFPEIRLNIHTKSVQIILYERRGTTRLTCGAKLPIKLNLSVSFFDICLKYEIETLCTKADEILTLSRSAALWKKALTTQAPTYKLYNRFMKIILKKPNIWLDVYSECINNLLKSEMCQASLKLSTDIRIPEKTFQKVIREVFPLRDKFLTGDDFLFRDKFLTRDEKESIQNEIYEQGYKIMIKQISTDIAQEIMDMKLSKEMHMEFLKITDEILVEQLANIVKKISEEIYNRILLEKDWDAVHLEMKEIVDLKRQNAIISLELLFDHCFQRDILEGTVSIEEKKFMFEQQKFFREMDLKMDQKRQPTVTVQEFYNFIRDYFKKNEVELSKVIIS